MSRSSKRLSGKQWNRKSSSNHSAKARTPKKPKPGMYKRSKSVSNEWSEDDPDSHEEQAAEPKESVANFHAGDFDWIANDPTVGFTETGEQTMKLHAAASSDIGFCRDKNEDSFCVDSDLGLYIVCDGMGGHIAGEVAARKAIEFTSEFFARACEHRILPRCHETDFRGVWSNLMVEAIEHCCEKVLALAQSNPEMDGMATTITAVKIVDGHVFVGHLGDSRLYLKSGNATKQLTTDHNLYFDISAQDSQWLDSITDVDALKRFKHVLTRFVGRKQAADVEVFSFPLTDQDVLLLCTDGLSNYLTDESALGEAITDQSPKAIVETLLEFANSEGGEDNVTAIAIRVEAEASNESRTNSAFSAIERYSNTHQREPQAFQ